MKLSIVEIVIIAPFGKYCRVTKYHQLWHS